MSDVVAQLEVNVSQHHASKSRTDGEHQLEYCPPLDSALLQAILLDFDLDDPAALVQARRTLDSLKATAADEDDGAIICSAPADSGLVSSTYEGIESETTSLSDAVSGLSVSVGDASGSDTPIEPHDLNTLDFPTKSLLLQELFPSVNNYTITHTLAKCNAEWQRALDELLNIAAFANENVSDNNKILNKGIDAFADTDPGKRGRRRKPKGQNARLRQSERRTQSVDFSVPQTQNIWRNAAQDIDFIAKHTDLSNALVRSAYYANDTSVPRTIYQLLDDFAQSTYKMSQINDSSIAALPDFVQEFPSLPQQYLESLLRLTHPSTQSARELARAMSITSTPQASESILPQYAKVNLHDDEVGLATAPTTPNLAVGAVDYTTAINLSSSHRAAHQRLSAQAQAAYRRSKSQRLMGGAAAYYADRAREHTSLAVAQSSAAADALVRTQSSANELDLHGVTVNDAVRIARRETLAWWDSLGEAKFNGRTGAESRQSGFRIIVGVGRHSEGGVSKIGPAVFKMLANEGWKVEKGEGVVTVRGKPRK